MEVEFLLKELEQAPSIIIDEVWNKIMLKLNFKFQNSPYLNEIQLMFEDFAKFNKRLYKDNLIEFIYDWEFSEKNVFVWTFHKAKWREFDTVIVDLYGIDGIDEEKIRLIYVALTRAKDNLIILWEKWNVIFEKLKEIAKDSSFNANFKKVEKLKKSKKFWCLF